MSYAAQRKEALARRMVLLPALGWKRQRDGRWRSPRGLRLNYEVGIAIAIEQLRGGIFETGKGWRITGPFDGRMERKKEV